MLQPSRLKYRKHFRGTMGGNVSTGSQVAFGDYGLKALSRGWLTSRQIESARKAITHYTKRAGKLWIRVFPDKTYTKKAAGVRMGEGKGEIEGYVCVIKPGRVIFELAGIDKQIVYEAFRRAGQKLPFKIKVTKRR